MEKTPAFLEGLDEAIEGLKESPLPAKRVATRIRAKATKEDIEVIREEEDALFRDATTVIRDAMQFYVLDPDETEVPPEWILEYGEAEAKERFRRVKAGQMSMKESPVGIKVAMSVASSVIKARGNERAAPRLNVAVMNIPNLESYPRYDEMLVEND